MTQYFRMQYHYLIRLFNFVQVLILLFSGYSPEIFWCTRWRSGCVRAAGYLRDGRFTVRLEFILPGKTIRLTITHLKVVSITNN